MRRQVLITANVTDFGKTFFMKMFLFFLVSV